MYFNPFGRMKFNEKITNEQLVTKTNLLRVCLPLRKQKDTLVPLVSIYVLKFSNKIFTSQRNRLNRLVESHSEDSFHRIYRFSVK